MRISPASLQLATVASWAPKSNANTSATCPANRRGVRSGCFKSNTRKEDDPPPATRYRLPAEKASEVTCEAEGEEVGEERALVELAAGNRRIVLPSATPERMMELSSPLVTSTLSNNNRRESKDA